MITRTLAVATALALVAACVLAGPVEALAQAVETPADTTGGSTAEAVEGAVSEEAAESEETAGTETDAAGSDEEEAPPDDPREGVAPESSLRVLRAYVCKGIEESEPTEAGRSFIPAVDGILRLCCFSEIGCPAEPDTVFHVWYWGEREMARVPLYVKGPRWRTWSSKKILDEWRGEWRVDVTDRPGVVLSRLEFSVE